jgi:hypothetical protein
MKLLFAFLVLTAITLLKSSAYAVNYAFAGNLDSKVGTISIGTSFTGSFSYSHPQALTETHGSNYSIYPVMSGHFSLTIGSETVSINGIDSGSITMYNKWTVLPPDSPVGAELGVDSFQILFEGPAFLQEHGFFGGRKVFGLGITLSDASGNVFPDTGLAGGGMRLDQFTSTRLLVKFEDNPSGWWRSGGGIVTSLIPEPSSLSLLALGGLAIAFNRRRRA